MVAINAESSAWSFPLPLNMIVEDARWGAGGAGCGLANFTATLQVDAQKYPASASFWRLATPQSTWDEIQLLAIARFTKTRNDLCRCLFCKASTISAMATSRSSAFQHVLATFKAKLDPELASEFEITTIVDLKRALASIQHKHNSERRVRNMGRLSRFLDAMDQYGKVIEVFLNVTDVLAFVWVHVHHMNFTLEFLRLPISLGPHEVSLPSELGTGNCSFKAFGDSNKSF
jgi:hypothetical protein